MVWGLAAKIALAASPLLGKVSKTIVTKVAPVVAKGAVSVAKAAQSKLFGTPTKTAVTTVAAGVLTTSPTVRKAAVATIKAEPLLLISPTYVTGKSAGKVAEKLLTSNLQNITPGEVALGAGAVGLVAAGGVAAYQAIKDKKAETPMESTLPKTTSPDKSLNDTALVAPVTPSKISEPVVGAIPVEGGSTALKKSEPSTRITFKPHIAVRNKPTVVVQNVISR